MLILRPVLFLALCLSLNTTIASEKLGDTVTASHANGNYSPPLAERPGSRRRGIGGDISGCDTSPDLWALNIFCETLSFCYVTPNKVKLWRPENSKRPLGQVQAVIKSRATRQKVELSWPAQEYLAWPEQMPIESGSTYMLTLKKRGSNYLPRSRVLYQIPAKYQTLDEKAVKWMRENGCIAQAEKLDHKSKVKAKIVENGEREKESP